MKLITRKQWLARPPGQGSTSIDPEGTTVHWDGEGWRWSWEHSTCYTKVRAIQDYHMDVRDWSDIAYNFLACPHGYVFEGRGLNRRSSANGSTEANTSWYAVQCMWGSRAGVTPPNNLLIAARDAIDYLRIKGGAGNGINGHRDHKQTDCPGNHLYAWVKNRCPRPGIITQPQSPVGDDMTTQEFDKLMAKFESLATFNKNQEEALGKHLNKLHEFNTTQREELGTHLSELHEFNKQQREELGAQFTKINEQLVAIKNELAELTASGTSDPDM